MRHTAASGTAPVTLLLVMWLVEFIDYFVPATPFDLLGIRPRDTDALPSILIAPFLHGGFAHLAANSIPFLVLGVLIATRRRADFAVVFAQAMLISGAGTWLFGTPRTIHIGSSGVVFGMFGFLLSRAVFERSAVAIVVSAVTLLLYGGMLSSLLTLHAGVSWSGHLFGLIGGVIAAWSRPRPR